MGTAKESNRSGDENEEEEIIPWKFVPHLVRQGLIRKLNPNAAMSGNDWRMLACELGYSQWDINYIESDKDNNTKVLFSMYDKKPGASFNEVYKSLVKIQRQDCLDILNDAALEIKQAYIRARESQMYHVAETSDGSIIHWSSPPCPCTYSPHPTSVCGTHSYCSCNRGFASCGCAGHSHPLNHSPYHGHSLPPHPHQPACQNFSPSEILQKICVQGLPSLRQVSPAHSHLIQEPLNCHERNTHLSPSGYDSSNNRVNPPMSQVFGHRGQTSLSPGHISYRESHPYNFNENVNNSNSLISSDSSGSESLNSRQKFTRQRSDSCNVTPDSSRDKRCRYDGDSRGVNQQGAALPGTTYHDANSMGKLRNIQSPKFAHHPSASNYVDHSEPPDCKVKVEDIEWSRDEKYAMGSSPTSSGSSWNRNHPSSTFPMRVKPKQDRAMEEMRDLTISKKSTSMPQNMKPREYRKVFRHIKVFVTYSYNSEDHAKQVLSLCRFLQANGFACCVDVSEKRNSEKASEQLEWCMRKVAEADFILVCISHKYLEDIGSNRQTSSMSEHRLHTREIYDLMSNKHFSSQHSSFANNGGTHSSPSFIPLLFPEMKPNHIPHWMRSGTSYNWPDQYKDLAWMLTKPQERIKAKRESQDEREL